MFVELQKTIRDLPITMLPATLKTVVEECHRKNVFNPGGLENMVRKILIQEGE